MKNNNARTHEEDLEIVSPQHEYSCLNCNAAVIDDEPPLRCPVCERDGVLVP